METILIIDSNPDQLRMAEHAIGQKLRYQVIIAASAREAIDRVADGKQHQPDIILVDLTMPGSGTDIIRALRSRLPSAPVIVLIPYGEEAQKVDGAVQSGACDVLTKPVTMGRLRLSIQNALKLQRMANYITRMERKQNGHIAFTDIIGDSPSIKQAVVLAKASAPSMMPVWIEGEPGNGKEHLARAVHGESNRAGQAFVAVDCRALADDNTLLFGQKDLVRGKWNEAAGGTLLLKNIEVLPEALQRRLLAMMDGAQIEKTLPNIRIICSTTAKIEPIILQGEFSRTLCQRLKGITISLPPLRERREDVSPLAKHFVRQFAASEGRTMYGLTEQALNYLTEASWPGNVRQLAHLLWRAVMMCNQDLLDAGNIRLIQQWQPACYQDQDGLNLDVPGLLDRQGRLKNLKSIEEEAIRLALHHTGGCMTRAARTLGIGRSTLYRRVNELNISYIPRENQETRPMINASSGERS
jgi:DNA-binding NtrC family response regulator